MANTAAMIARLPAMLGRGLLKALQLFILRGYPIALMLVIVWLSWGAIHYLFTSLLSPTPSPAAIAGVPRKLDAATLRESRPEWAGLQAAENPRAPLAHFHRFDTWIEPDRFNDCTRSGCHAPLPHSKSKELRAFLNMHATSLHCGVCHFKSESQPLPLAWYDLNNGKPGTTPAALRAYAQLEDEPNFVKLDRGQLKKITDLLREVADVSHVESLKRIAREIDGTRPGTDRITPLLQMARDAVRREFRGSYGSKLAVLGSDGKPIFAHPNTQAAVREWLQSGAKSEGATRERLLAAVHPNKRESPPDCKSCHTAERSQVDFAKLGYPPSRARSLYESQIFDMIRHIAEGRPFYLPSFGGANNDAANQPTTAPASAPATKP